MKLDHLNGSDMRDSVDEEAELRDWANIRQQLMRFAQSGGFAD